METAQKTGLADAGVADERDEVRARVAHDPLVGHFQQLELVVAADEGAAWSV